MSIPKFSIGDTQEFAALSPNEKNEFLGRQLSQMVSNGDAKLNIVAALDTGLRDYIIRAHNEFYGDRLLSWGIYGTVALALGFGGGTYAAGNSWWGAILAGLLTFFLVGYFVSKFTTTLAIKRIVSMFYGHFEFLWDAKVLSVRFSDAEELLDSRKSSEWHDAIQVILGLSSYRR